MDRQQTRMAGGQQTWVTDGQQTQVTDCQQTWVTDRQQTRVTDGQQTRVQSSHHEATSMLAESPLPVTQYTMRANLSANHVGFPSNSYCK